MKLFYKQSVLIVCHLAPSSCECIIFLIVNITPQDDSFLYPCVTFNNVRSSASLTWVRLVLMMLADITTAAALI